MTRSWKRALVLLTLLVGCDHAPPIVDGCHVVCECRGFLEREIAACERVCQDQAANPENTAVADCLFCADEAETCSAYTRDCAALCASASGGLSGGNP